MCRYTNYNVLCMWIMYSDCTHSYSRHEISTFDSCPSVVNMAKNDFGCSAPSSSRSGAALLVTLPHRNRRKPLITERAN
jgi:hypothetical protein